MHNPVHRAMLDVRGQLSIYPPIQSSKPEHRKSRGATERNSKFNIQNSKLFIIFAANNRDVCDVDKITTNK